MIVSQVCHLRQNKADLNSLLTRCKAATFRKEISRFYVYMPGDYSPKSPGLSLCFHLTLPTRQILRLIKKRKSLFDRSGGQQRGRAFVSNYVALPHTEINNRDLLRKSRRATMSLTDEACPGRDYRTSMVSGSSVTTEVADEAAEVEPRVLPTRK